jgi:hypothetical protein
MPNTLRGKPLKANGTKVTWRIVLLLYTCDYYNGLPNWVASASPEDFLEMFILMPGGGAC